MVRESRHGLPPCDHDECPPTRCVRLPIEVTCDSCRHSRFAGFPHGDQHTCDYKDDSWVGGGGEICERWLPVRRDLKARISQANAR